MASIEEVTRQLHAVAERATARELLTAVQEIEAALSIVATALAGSSDPEAQAAAGELTRAVQLVYEAHGSVVTATATWP